MHRATLAPAVLTALLVFAVAVRAEPQRRLYMVGVSHLDTQWYFNIQETIREHLPATFGGTFELFERFPGFRFSWEGAYRYMLLEEYYPDLFAQLSRWVKADRWAPGGSSLEAGDVNVPSPEALLRHILIGNRYFREKLGKSSLDIFLPDCFGFGYALPAVAAHCGLTGFSTQKLHWGSAAGIPFGIGLWTGVDGRSLVASLATRGYTEAIDHDLSTDEAFLNQCAATFPDDQLTVGYNYFGVGDEGGPVRAEDVAWLEESLAGEGPVEVLSAFSDQLFRDLTPEQIEQLPRYDGELLLTTHGTGAYTSQSALKRWNRNNELLANATERAALLADWAGLAAYPAERLRATWIRFLAQHFHDVLPGTSTADVYAFAWNDELLALNQLTAMMTDSLGALAAAFDTDVAGLPLLLFNPLALSRTDTVAATVRYPGDPPQFVALFDPEGNEVPSQILRRGSDWLEILFVATVGPLELALFEVRPAGADCDLPTGLAVADRTLENDRYRVELNEAGEIAAIEDKELGRQLLAAPIRLALWDNNSSVWPAWELLWSDLAGPPREFVGGPATMTVVDEGPARVAIEVSRQAGPSMFVQRVTLAAGEAGDRVEIAWRIDWHSHSSTLKAIFPLASANPLATYDLGLGTIARGNNTELLYEVPAQQWADLSAPDGSFGVTISNDCKHGWDKPDDQTLRLTLLATPLDWPLSKLRYGQHTQDLGPHLVKVALHGHAGDWRGRSWPVAARLNQPVIALQVARRTGGEARRFSPVLLSGGDVDLRALKRAEDGDGYAVRIAEMAGQKASGISFAFGQGIDEAEELDGMEDPLGPVQLEEGRLVADFGPFQMRTFRIRPLALPAPPAGRGSRQVALPFNLDVISGDVDRGDGVMGPDQFQRPVSLPAEQLPEQLDDGGIVFQLGSSAPGALNAVECRGQEVALPEVGEGDRLFILAAGLGEQSCTFELGAQLHAITVPDFTRRIGSWVGRVKSNVPLDNPDLFLLDDPADFMPPYYRQQRIAWYTTHRHLADGDDPYEFTYLFRFALPLPPGATSVRLPDNAACRLLAMTLSDSPATRAVPATALFAEHDPRAWPIDWPLMAPSEEPPDPPADAGNEDQPEPTPANCNGCVHSPRPPTTVPALLLLVLVAIRCRRRLLHLSSMCTRRGQPDDGEHSAFGPGAIG